MRRLGATLSCLIGLSWVLALPLAAQVRDAHPRSGAVRAARLLARGETYLAAGDRGSAIGYFRDAIEADPLEPRAYLRLGEAYRERGSLDDARTILEAGIMRAPDDAALWLALVTTLVAFDQPEQAAAAVRGLLARQPDHGDALRMRAELARARGAWSEALTAYRALLARGALDEAEAEQTRLYERALRQLARPLDPVSAPRACAGSPVRQALAGCDEAPTARRSESPGLTPPRARRPHPR